jgi:hypothetical protein
LKKCCEGEVENSYIGRRDKRCWESEEKIALREMEKVWGREGEKKI